MEKAETMTYGSKPHAPEGQGWFPRGRGAACSPLGHPGDNCHPGDRELPPALARSQAGRRCRMAAKATAWEPAPSTLTPRRGAMPRAGEGGRGEGEQGQPETPRTGFSRHVLRSQRPAPAPLQRGSRICPSSPNNAGVHLSLLRALGAESRRCPRQGSPGQAPALPTGRGRLPSASSHRSIRFLRRLAGAGTVAFPSPMGPPQRQPAGNPQRHPAHSCRTPGCCTRGWVNARAKILGWGRPRWLQEPLISLARQRGKKLPAFILQEWGD